MTEIYDSEESSTSYKSNKSNASTKIDYDSDKNIDLIKLNQDNINDDSDNC